MTTSTRPSRIVYEVRCGSWLIGSGKDREEAELVRDAHAERTNQPRERYLICPVARKEKE